MSDEFTVRDFPIGTEVIHKSNGLGGKVIGHRDKFVVVEVNNELNLIAKAIQLVILHEVAA